MTQQNTKTPMMLLNEFSAKFGYVRPEYIPDFCQKGSEQQNFYFKVVVAGVCGRGSGNSKQVAKHAAAANTLEILAQKGLFKLESKTKPVQVGNESDSSSVNYILILETLCTQHKLPRAEFCEVSAEGPPHYRKFTFECTVNSMVARSAAKTKREAKKLAAKEMINQIKEVYCEVSEDVTPTEDVPPTKEITIDDFYFALKEIMIKKNIKLEDFSEQFKTRTKKGLSQIFGALDVKYKIQCSNYESLPIASAAFELDTPFTMVTVGSSKKSAEVNLISQIYSCFNMYLSTAALTVNLLETAVET